MHAAGVRNQSDNGVKLFAMNYAKERLNEKFSNIIEVDNLNHGCDFEARDETEETVHIEAKGQSADADVGAKG
jgi:hypothetical protein